jgi:DnaK suppressor protein
MVLDPKQIEELKSALLTEKKGLEDDLSRIARPINSKRGDYETAFEDIGPSKDDNANEVEQYTDMLPVEITLEKKLQDVIDALEKIEKGNYDTCENCQEVIGLERLRANPSARTCIKCK